MPLRPVATCCPQPPARPNPAHRRPAAAAQPTNQLTPVGLTIFRSIHAIDRDKPNTANSDITYSIVVSLARPRSHLLSWPIVRRARLMNPLMNLANSYMGRAQRTAGQHFLSFSLSLSLPQPTATCCSRPPQHSNANSLASAPLPVRLHRNWRPTHLLIGRAATRTTPSYCPTPSRALW